MVYVLGIDGGGSTTTGVITNEKGQVLCKAVVGSSNLNSASRTRVIKELEELVLALEEQNKQVYLQVNHVFAGMAGVRDDETKQEVIDILTQVLGKSVTINVDTDAITALYSGTLGEPGIVQIAGTGAMTYGENSAGQRGRVGGWGHLFSDHGSGYAIGRDGLDAAFMALDGVSGPTLVTSLLLQHFKVKELTEIIQPIYRNDNPKKMIASLSKLVVQAADQGDRPAREIINYNGQQLGKSIATLSKRLFGENPGTVIPLVLTGGIFNRYDLMVEAIEAQLGEEMEFRYILPKVEPVCGAVIAAYRMESIKLSESFVETFHKSFTLVT